MIIFITGIIIAVITVKGLMVQSYNEWDRDWRRDSAEL